MDRCGRNVVPFGRLRWQVGEAIREEGSGRAVGAGYSRGAVGVSSYVAYDAVGDGVMEGRVGARVAEVPSNWTVLAQRRSLFGRG